VRIEDGAFIGTNAIILKGVTVGAESVIAAGAVVAKSIPPGEIWGGNPARFIKKLKP
jgi:acetyltransferase-like isoleucine patch superfamily enzyme